MICVIYAHPYPRRSRACARLLAAVSPLPQLEVRSLYDLYPDFDIDGEAERRAIDAARLVLWMHPVYWYTAPAMMKHWFEQVLSRGWAYGENGGLLKGKDCLWVSTTGGDEQAYVADGRHDHPSEANAAVMEQTARFCAMRWLEPFTVHAAHLVSDAELDASAAALRTRIEQWREAGA